MESVAQGNFASLVFLGALMVVIAFLLLRSQRYFARQERIATPASMAEPSASAPRKPAHHLGASSELVQWEVEMHDVARDLAGKLDSKMSALEHLIRDADRAAARLETALEAMQQAGVATSNHRPPAHDVERLEPHRLPTWPANQADALKTAGPVDAPPRAASSAERLPADRRYEEIYLLADYGFAPAEIAHRVSMPIGEIQLILSLRAKR